MRPNTWYKFAPRRKFGAEPICPACGSPRWRRSRGVTSNNPRDAATLNAATRPPAGARTSREGDAMTRHGPRVHHAAARSWRPSKLCVPHGSPAPLDIISSTYCSDFAKRSSSDCALPSRQIAPTPILQGAQTVTDAPTTTANIRNPHKHPTVDREFVLRRFSYAYGVRKSPRTQTVGFGVTCVAKQTLAPGCASLWPYGEAKLSGDTWPDAAFNSGRNDSLA